MPKKVEMIDREFGRLTVIARFFKKRVGRTCWICLCKCGEYIIIPGNSLIGERTKSCGCLRRESILKSITTHGMSKTPTYKSWVGIISRCKNPNNKRYGDYGGRGITVSNAWLKFENFFADMGERPKGLTIERRDNMAGYCKSNCCWADYTAQSRNQRTQKDNLLGVRGVRWHKQSKRYQARITVNKKLFSLGLFKTIQAAIVARKKGEKLYWRKEV